MSDAERYSLPTETLDRVFGVLAALPYGQVAELIAEMQATTLPVAAETKQSKDVSLLREANDG